jgi:site-specific DNA-methyltransferase (adenine-specific)
MVRGQQTLPVEIPRIDTNVLYYGDNLIWLKNHDYFPSDSIDLIYLDPPFNSNVDYNILFNEKTGEQSQAQWKAFDDTWKWEKEASYTAIHELSVIAPTISEFILWLSRRGDTKSISMAAYLSMMAIRLIELHRVLSSTGSLWLHCDPTASHYLKVLLDLIFREGKQQGALQNEVIWAYEGGGSSGKRFGRKHDVLLWYTKSKRDFVFDADAVRVPYKTENIGPQTYHYETNKKRRPIFKKGFTWLPNPKGKVSTDVWVDIKKPYGPSKELLGFPTQKPLALLDRIIGATSVKGQIVLDPFCGCGTTIISAQSNNRRWIGIDVTYLAINLIENRLKNDFQGNINNTYIVRGDPVDTASAQALFDRDNKDKHAFELWALKLVKAQARSKDGGVDGIIGFLDANSNLQRIVVQVKGGATLSPSIIRDLIGTVQKEDAAIGLLVSLHAPTKGMYQDANHAGEYKDGERLYKKIQIRTITELLEENKSFDLPYENSVLIRKEQRKQELLF